MLYKAARGATFPVASAKDAARAAVWMQRSQPLRADGIEGFALMIEAIAHGPTDVSSLIEDVAGEDTIAARGGSIIDVGPCLLDALAAEPTCRTVVADQVGGATLMIGMLFGPTAPTPSPLIGLPRLEVEKAEDGLTQVKVWLAADNDGGAVVRIGSTSLSPTELAVNAGQVDVDEELWEQARHLAAATYVPSSEASRQGAGAGLTDND